MIKTQADIFSQFDENNDGLLDKSEYPALCELLGVSDTIAKETSGLFSRDNKARERGRGGRMRT